MAQKKTLQLEDFIEKNRCRVFVKKSEKSCFVPVWESLQVVGSALPREPCGNSSDKPAGHQFYIQMTVLKQTDCQSCLRDLCDMSLRKEADAWLLLWVLQADRRFLARLNADSVILQGALVHRSFWLVATEDYHLALKKGSSFVPKFDHLLPMVAPQLGRQPDRTVCVSFTWLPCVSEKSRAS